MQRSLKLGLIKISKSNVLTNRLPFKKFSKNGDKKTFFAIFFIKPYYVDVQNKHNHQFVKLWTCLLSSGIRTIDPT